MESLPHGIRQEQKKEKHPKRCEIDQQRFQFELQIEKRELTQSHEGYLGLGI